MFKLKTFALLSIPIYLIFFGKLLNPNIAIYSGKDSINHSYPAAFYLHEKLHNGEFPFYTERIFMGFPAYAEIEWGYLNPLYVAALYVFSPVTVIKLIHFLTYLLGSYGLFKLFEKHKFSLSGFFAGNLVYFFSFFLLYHQQHFNMTRIAYLIPLLIWLTHKFLESSTIKNFVKMLLALAFMIYFGSYQTVLIALTTQAIYFGIFSKTNLKKILRLTALYSVSGILIALPISLPAMELFSQGVRNDLSYSEGSISPLDLSAIIFPFPYGDDSKYFGETLNFDRFKHETYIYIGISTFLVAILGYIKSDEKLRRFFRYLLLVFLILSLIKYLPILNSYLLPPYSMFRFWGRAVILLNLGLAFLVGQSFTNSSKKNVGFKNFLPHFFIILVATALWFYFENIRNIAFQFANNFEVNSNLWIWLALLISTAFVLTRNFKHQNLLIIGLLCFDLLFFGKQVIKNDFKTLAEIIPGGTETLYYSQGLFRKEKGQFGYTQLVNEKYRNYMISLGYESEKIGSVNELHSLEKIPPKKGVITDISKEKEGNIMFSAISESNVFLPTNVRNYKDWKIKINGDIFEHPADELFITLPLQKGFNIVEMRFVPTTLVKAISISLSGLALLALYLKSRKNEQLL